MGLTGIAVGTAIASGKMAQLGGPAVSLDKDRFALSVERQGAGNERSVYGLGYRGRCCGWKAWSYRLWAFGLLSELIAS